MGERTTADRIRDLRAYLRGEVVRTTKGRPWQRGQEVLAREELARLLGPSRPTVQTMSGGETGDESVEADPAWVADFADCWGYCDPAIESSAGLPGCPAPIPEAP